MALRFNVTKFYNLVQQLDLGELMSRFTCNFALFTELIYFQEFLGRECKKTCFLISLLFKKLTVFGLVWIEKAKAKQDSALTKKLTEVMSSVKMYSIVLSLPITTTRKMFGYFHLLANKQIETRYEKLIVRNPYYIALHDFFYKNTIVSMYDYQNAFEGCNLQLYFE